MLTQYENSTSALLQAPSSPIPLFPTATIDSYINQARAQVATDAECIRVPATLALAAATQKYNFASLSVGGAAGVGSVMAVRSAFVGTTVLDVRPWEWFQAYYLASAATGTPVRLAQQGQGVNGTLYFSPIPTGVLTVTFDAVCLPIDLVDDTTAEAIPKLWTDAVPFYAAWYAFQSAQRQADADMMMARYKELIMRGRRMATPSELPDNLPGGRGAAMVDGKAVLGSVQAQARQ